jgi:flagellar motor component MotA
MQQASDQRDEEVKEALEASKQDYERKLGKIREEQDLLRYESRNEKRKRQNEIEDLRSLYEKKMEEQLSAQKMDFDHTVEQLMANQDKLRTEQRLAMDNQIASMKQQKKEKRSSVKLVLSLIPLLGSVTLAALGIPIGVSSDLFSNGP